MFYVNGRREATLLSLSKCLSVKQRIKTLCFYYLGKNEWAVVARDATGKEVKPAAVDPKR